MCYPIAALVLLLPLAALAQPRPVTDAEVTRIHRSTLLIDTHNDVTSETIKGLDIGPRRASGHTDLARLHEGNVGAVFFAACVSGTYEQGNHSANAPWR